MKPEELKQARHALGLSAEGFALSFGAASGRTVRGWEAGERNGKPQPVPQSVALLVRLALELPAARALLEQWGCRKGARGRTDRLCQRLERGLGAPDAIPGPCHNPTNSLTHTQLSAIA